MGGHVLPLVALDPLAHVPDDETAFDLVPDPARVEDLGLLLVGLGGHVAGEDGELFLLFDDLWWLLGGVWRQFRRWELGC